MLNLIQKKLQDRVVSPRPVPAPVPVLSPPLRRTPSSEAGGLKPCEGGGQTHTHAPSCVPQCDQVMEFSWSALWNITDETPDNCQMFLNCQGMSLFLECLEVSDAPSGGASASRRS